MHARERLGGGCLAGRRAFACVQFPTAGALDTQLAILSPSLRTYLPLPLLPPGVCARQGAGAAGLEVRDEGGHAGECWRGLG